MEPKQHTIVVAIITNEKNELLLAKRSEPAMKHAHNKWEFIGGGINFGENPADAIRREAKEEAGIEIKLISLLPEIYSHVWDYKNGERQQILIIAYKCKIISGSPTPGHEQEIAELKFFGIKEILELDTLPNVYKMAKMVLAD